MRVRILTLRYDEALRGFPEEPLLKLTMGAEVLEAREHFYIHAGVPHLTLVLLLDPGDARAGRFERGQAEDPARDLPPELVPLYRSLRQWRNERARRDGIPSCIVFRNAQLAEICRRRPRTLAELREIEGIGEATCKRYGADLLALLPAEPSQPQPSAAAPSPAPLPESS